MSQEWVVDIVERLPQGLMSRAWGWLARRRRPRTGVALLKRAFVAYAGIDMNESREGIGSFDTLEELFVRDLRAGVRRIEPDPTAVVSPVDGTVGACGRVEDGLLLQVKGRNYTLASLLDDSDLAEAFERGEYATIYLAPKDYHRIHSPVSGVVKRARVIPGGLMPVFPAAVEKVDELFARNERLISYVESADGGLVAVVKVGAMMVGRISVTYDPGLRTQRPGQASRAYSYEPPHLIQKGAHLGTFELGSTVVIISQQGKLALDNLIVGRPVRMGQRIGSLTSRSRKKSASDRVEPSGTSRT